MFQIAARKSRSRDLQKQSASKVPNWIYEVIFYYYVFVSGFRLRRTGYSVARYQDYFAMI